LQHNKILIRQLGLQPYEPVSQAMHEFTDTRDDATLDEIWLVEHYPVFTQGQAGKAEHVLVPGEIPVIQSDRGGQVTYHGPGQQVMYVLLNLKRRKLGVRELVTLLEQLFRNQPVGLHSSRCRTRRRGDRLSLRLHRSSRHGGKRRQALPRRLRGRSKNLLPGFAHPQRLLIPRPGAEYQHGSVTIPED